MICRGGLVNGAGINALRSPVVAHSTQRAGHLHALPTISAIAVLSILLAAISGLLPIPPLIESDYCYLLTAAERWYAGLGPTTTPPVAPHQPWEWQADWRFLTQWPVGYPALLVALRRAFGLTMLQSCHIVACIACAGALVGWFAWLRRLAPVGWTGLLLAAVAAGSAVTTGLLVNPSTDLLLVAALPFVLLTTANALNPGPTSPADSTRRRGMLAAAGLLAGGLFWIRYASLFVPAGVALYLGTRLLRRRSGFYDFAAFCLGAAMPVAALVIVNRAFGSSDSIQSQLNLGRTIQFSGSIETLQRAWWTLTNLGYYDHRSAAHWLFALLPAAVLVGSLTLSSARGGIAQQSGRCEVGLSACTLLVGLGMLVAGSAFFRAKFDFVGLDRYYLPLRPLYFAMFVSPLVLFPSRWVRVSLCTGLVLAGLWTVQQEWVRDYRRWATTDRPASPYGQWSRCFEPGAGELLRWLKEHDDPSLVVVSNFHEYVALETMIPALPIPPDRPTFEKWLAQIQVSRGITAVHPVFVLGPSNQWRNGWIASPEEIMKTFNLRNVDLPGPVGVYVFEPALTTPS